MLGAIFSFRGRIGRLRYFLTSLGLGAVTLLPVVVVSAGVTMSANFGGRPSVMLMILAVIFMLAAIPAYFWGSLALQAKRFRDIGWEPLYAIPAWFGLQVLDIMIGWTVPSLSLNPLTHQTFLGALVNLGFGGCLLFWPGKAADDAETPASSGRPKPAPRPTAAPATAGAWRAAPVQPSGFGRKGL